MGIQSICSKLSNDKTSLAYLADDTQFMSQLLQQGGDDWHSSLLKKRNTPHQRCRNKSVFKEKSLVGIIIIKFDTTIGGSPLDAANSTQSDSIAFDSTGSHCTVQNTGNKIASQSGRNPSAPWRKPISRWWTYWKLQHGTRTYARTHTRTHARTLLNPNIPCKNGFNRTRRSRNRRKPISRWLPWRPHWKSQRAHFRKEPSSTQPQHTLQKWI